MVDCLAVRRDCLSFYGRKWQIRLRYRFFDHPIIISEHLLSSLLCALDFEDHRFQRRKTAVGGEQVTPLTFELLPRDCLKMDEVEGAVDPMQSQQYYPRSHQMRQLPVFLLLLHRHQQLLELWLSEERDEDVGGVVEGEVAEALEKLT